VLQLWDGRLGDAAGLVWYLTRRASADPGWLQRDSSPTSFSARFMPVVWGVVPQRPAFVGLEQCGGTRLTPSHCTRRFESSSPAIRPQVGASISTMPPKRQHHDEASAIKEKLQGARDRRNGRAAATNGSSLKEVDNASVHSGQTSIDSNPSNVCISRASQAFGGRVTTTVGACEAHHPQ
jgi:hypothetical protein